MLRPDFRRLLNPLPASETEQHCALPRMIGCMLYDAMIVLAIWFAVTVLLLMLRRGAAIAPATASFQALLLVTAWAYFAVSWRHGGQTLGMRAWRVHIRCADGRVRWWQTAVRFLVAGVSVLVLGLGYIWVVVYPARLTWHDMASRTWLVHRPARPD